MRLSRRRRVLLAVTGDGRCGALHGTGPIRGERGKGGSGAAAMTGPPLLVSVNAAGRGRSDSRRGPADTDGAVPRATSAER